MTSPAPRGALGECDGEEVHGELVDQAGGFCERYEAVRGQSTERWVVPPDESFGTDDEAGSQVNLGLVVQHELLGSMVERHAEVCREGEPLGAAAVHAGFVDSDRPVA